MNKFKEKLAEVFQGINHANNKNYDDALIEISERGTLE